MPVDDLGNDGEAEADAGLLRGDEGIENGLDLVGRNAAAAIDYARPRPGRRIRLSER